MNTNSDNESRRDSAVHGPAGGPGEAFSPGDTRKDESLGSTPGDGNLTGNGERSGGSSGADSGAIRAPSVPPKPLDLEAFAIKGEFLTSGSEGPSGMNLNGS